MAGRMLRKLCFTKGISASKRLENSLPGNTMETCSRSQYLPITRRAPVTTQSSSSLAYEDGTFQAGADDRCTRACGCLYRPYSPTRPTTASPTRLYFEAHCHLKVLVFSVLLPRRQANYDSTLVVVDRLWKILRDEPVQIPIEAPRFPDSIVSD